MKQQVLTLPKDIDVDREHRNVSIDIDIVDEILYLWKNKIETLGCCSGHGKTNPSIVIESGYNDKGIKEIESLLKKIDKTKTWDILQWRIKKVN